MQVNTEVDTSELEDVCKSLSSLQKNFPSVCRQMMNAINKEVKKNLQRVSRTRGYDRQHNFYRGIFAHAGFKNKQKDYRHLYDLAGIGCPKGVRGKYNYYANTIENGAHIDSRKPFKVLINGQWKTLQKFDVPARPFVRNIINSWYGSKGNPVIDKTAQKILQKYGL